MEPKLTAHLKTEAARSEIPVQHDETGIKWPEIWSLAALNAAIVICWIAYHEYQPRLLAGFGLTHLAMFLVFAKAIILVLIPPIAGLLTDRMIKKNNKVYVVFLVGIGGTAMIFMIVATILFQGPASFLTPILPAMVILWLIGMNIFYSPANSLIESFTSEKNLPVAMGIIVFVTELLYALEPVVVALVDFFGATLTFVVGGILIGVTGYIFLKVSRDEVLVRKQEQKMTPENKEQKSNFLLVSAIALIFGIGHAFIVEFLPDQFNRIFSITLDGSYFSSFILFAIAILAIPVSRRVIKNELTRYIRWSIILLTFSILLITLIPGGIPFLTGSILLAFAFCILSVTALPLAIRNLTVRNLTFGVGVFFGIAAIADGIADILKGI
jgi:MFS family permease